ncbi:DUF2207 domain-containing protein [Pelagibacterium lentulum]|uniref:DUF2207 domain-containing protein n=1 Tax=Pelagibacterium lentulum TaxID=2029865 RepID=A0A916W096_9HYPH|nr:DUF2207 domain-containing protein [Pelagibacterium lentulum]GGA55910.1 hypothetical protein GCM10011499_27570 [Pelagibacterium lentulum]
MVKLASQVIARLWLAAALILVSLPALAQEVIRSFDTAIVVNTDMSVTITESIEVNVEGQEIRRGIFRDIPTVLEGPHGSSIRSDLDVISVTRNGNAEPYSVESIRDGQRIRIGSAGAMLNRGVHRYQIRYTMDRAARLFDSHDEIYWNATGNFWQFPIERATSVVTLPDGARIIDLSAYTGKQGETGAESSVERLSDTQARFTTLHPLRPYEGLTVAVAFEKGVLVAPEGSEALGYWLSDNRGFLIPAILVLLVLAYNGLAWNKVGRDPAKGVIFPRFYPPEGYSPALTHYVHRMGWTNSGWTAFSAALVSLARKGVIEIETEGKTNTLRPTGKTPDEMLPPGEAVIFNYLDGQDKITIDKKTGPSLNTTRGKFISAIERENSKVYFKNNTAFIVLGAVLGVVSLIVMAATEVLDPSIVVLCLFLTVGVTIFGVVLHGVWQGNALGKIRIFVTAAVALTMFSGLISELLDLFDGSFAVVATIVIVAITVIFGILMRAPTVHGRKVMDEIDGFKMYLETAEKERLNFQKEPEMTTARFEQILPYAMALGVEKPWSERFESDLARNAVKDARQGYHPHWYRSSSFSPGALASSMSGVATGLSSAMVAAQPAKSSSSGFSGGSSGGGGGGGGGGGW